MAELPRSTSLSPSAGGVDAESTVPAWLAARRARGPVEVVAEADDVEFESVPEAESLVTEGPAATIVTAPVASESVPDLTSQFDFTLLPPRKSPPAVPLLFTAASQPPSLSSDDSRRPVPAKAKGIGDLPLVSARAIEESVPEDNSLEAIVLRWIRSATMAGVFVSVLVHTVILSVLALLVMHGAAIHSSLEILGMPDDLDEKLTDIQIDTMSDAVLDPGKEASPLEFPDMTQMMSNTKAAFDPGEMLQGAVGGKGKGSGDGSGDGEAMAVPALNIPKYAVTKGSFSAWTDPRDPEPGISYHIVIQYKLPAHVKTYRGSDLTGMVIGTDDYKQVIKLSKTEAFPVKDGIVQIRVLVPGAAKRVRDTIRLESKILREKQVIEIEF